MHKGMDSNTYWHLWISSPVIMLRILWIMNGNFLKNFEHVVLGRWWISGSYSSSEADTCQCNILISLQCFHCMYALISSVNRSYKISNVHEIFKNITFDVYFHIILITYFLNNAQKCLCAFWTCSGGKRLCCSQDSSDNVTEGRLKQKNDLSWCWWLSRLLHQAFWRLGPFAFVQRTC